MAERSIGPGAVPTAVFLLLGAEEDKVPDAGVVCVVVEAEPPVHVKLPKREPDS